MLHSVLDVLLHFSFRGEKRCVDSEEEGAWRMQRLMILMVFASLNACEQGTVNTSHVSGSVTEKEQPLSDVTLFVMRLGRSEMTQVAEVVSNEDGTFSFQLSEPGSYAVAAGAERSDGAYIQSSAEFLTFNVLGSEPLVLPTIEMQWEEFASEEDISALEQGLGVARGCVAIGCGLKRFGGLRWLCCGYSLCVTGVEGCIPYWRG